MKRRTTIKYGLGIQLHYSHVRVEEERDKRKMSVRGTERGK